MCKFKLGKYTQILFGLYLQFLRAVFRCVDADACRLHLLTPMMVPSPVVVLMVMTFVVLMLLLMLLWLLLLPLTLLRLLLRL
jgi:hypothetical protein